MAYAKMAPPVTYDLCKYSAFWGRCTTFQRQAVIRVDIFIEHKTQLAADKHTMTSIETSEHQRRSASNHPIETRSCIHTYIHTYIHITQTHTYKYQTLKEKSETAKERLDGSA